MADIVFSFEDNSLNVMNALGDAVGKFLIEASSELVSQTERNSRVDTGQTKGSWSSNIDESAGEAMIGSPLENALWEEFGTGEYAAEGGGRKGGWYIPEERLSEKAKSKMKKVVGKDGKIFYFTKGKKPNHTLQRAFDSKKEVIKRRADEIFSSEMGD